MKYFIAIDIGGTKCAVSAADSENYVIFGKRAFATNARLGWRQAVDGILNAVDELLKAENIDASQVLAAGISCGGPLNSKTGVIMCPPNLPDWDNVPITSIVEQRFGFKAFLQNDANACALAEWKFGAGRGCENMVFLTFGTGMGAGLILNGALYAGTNDMAGEVGHIRLSPTGPVGYGKEGSFEGYCSGGGIARYAASKLKDYLARGGKTALCSDESEIDAVTAKSVALAAEAGDEFSEQVYRECGEKLGEGLSVLIDVLNPERIVIGSIFARSEMLLREGMENKLKAEALPLSLGVCSVVPAGLGEAIGDMAALGVAVAGYERMNEK